MGTTLIENILSSPLETNSVNVGLVGAEIYHKCSASSSYQHYVLLTHEFSDLRMGVSHRLCHSDFLHNLAHGSHEPHLIHDHTVELCFAAVDDSQSDNLVGRCVQKTVGEILGAMTRCVITSIACQVNRRL